MEHEKLAKSHGILWLVMEFYQFAPELYQKKKIVTTKKLSSDLESPHFPQNVVNAKLGREMVMENQVMVITKSH